MRLRRAAAISACVVAALLGFSDLASYGRADPEFQIKAAVESVFVRSLAKARLGFIGDISKFSPPCASSDYAGGLESVLSRPCRFFTSRILRRRHVDSVEIRIDDAIAITEAETSAFHSALRRLVSQEDSMALDESFAANLQKFADPALARVSFAVPFFRTRYTIVRIWWAGQVLTINLGKA